MRLPSAFRLFPSLVLLAIVAACRQGTAAPAAASSTAPAPPPPSAAANLEKITLGGGCFWCMEAIFQELDGVLSVESGYSGGRVPDPTYEQVSTGSTGHAEVVEVTFDRTKISLADLLRIFFTLHDPTTPDRQGADVGTQYRSIIFTRNARQERTALDVRAEIRDRGVWPGNIVTEVVPFEAFWKAETSHQDYFANHGQAPYCRLVIEPKVLKLRELYRSRLRK